MNKSNKYLSLILVLSLAACQPNNIATVNTPEIKNNVINKAETPKVNVSDKNNISVPNEKIIGYGMITSKDSLSNSSAKTLSISISYKSIIEGFKTKAVDCTAISRVKVAITGIGITTPIYAVGADSNNTVAASGCDVTATLSSVPYGKARIMTVEAYDSSNNLISGATIKAVFDVSADPTNVEISYKSTPNAKVIESMIATDDFVATRVNLTTLATKIDTITGVSGSYPNYTYTTHPSLVNTTNIATDLNTNGGDASALDTTDTDYKIAAATVTGTIAGLVSNDKVSIRVDDPLSTVKINQANGAFTVSNVTPGNWKTYITTESGNTFTYTSNSPFTTNTTASNTTNLGTITLSPATQITSISETDGNVDSTFTISGAGFTGATAVKIGGIESEFTINNDTSITVTVPAGTEAGSKSVAVTKNSTDYSSTDNFTVNNRTVYVKSGASGTNTGNSWTNAYTNLEIALKKSNSGDKIWVAKGTYKPTTTTITLTANANGASNVNTSNNDRNSTFQMKDGVEIYGGFVGNEASNYDLALRNFTTNETILSGDLNNSNTSNAGDSYNITIGANNSTLDGFTIKYAYSEYGEGHEGGGMFNNATSPTVRNIIFSDNKSGYGGAISNKNSASPTLTNITFSNNFAENGGAIFNSNSSSPTLNNVTFSSNSSNGNGGAMYNDNSSSPTLTNVTFNTNTCPNADGGGMYNVSSSPTLTNVSFSNNSSKDFGGGMFNYSSSSPTLTNVTFSSNSSTNGGGIVNLGSSPILNNVIFTNNSATVGGGLCNLTSSPILNNVIFTNNSATAGGGIFNQTSSPTIINSTFYNNSANGGNGSAILNQNNSDIVIKNSIFWNNSLNGTDFSLNTSINNSDFTEDSSTISNSDIQGDIATHSGGINGGGNVNTVDPLFVNTGNPIGPDGKWFTEDDGLALQTNSPVRDNGTMSGAPGFDITGRARPVGSGVSMGAYEEVSVTP